MDNIYKLKTGDTAFRRNTQEKWVEFTVNDSYLPLIKEFPEDYKPITPYKELLRNNVLQAWYEVDGKNLYLRVLPNKTNLSDGELESQCISAIQKIEKTQFDFVSYLNYPT